MTIDVASDIIGSIKILKIQDKIDIPEKLEDIQNEEKIILRLNGSDAQKDRLYQKIENYYSPILKEYYNN